MRNPTCRPAFTLVDLAAVVVMGGVLVVALTAGVRQIPSRDNQVMCLTNLHQIGAAIHAYAAEDLREQAIPIHMNMVGYNDANQPTGAGLDYWLWRCANWFAWGGQGASQTFRVNSSGGYWLSDDPNVPADAFQVRPEYASAHRPLSGYLPPGPLTTFHCPSDTGYPNDPLVDDSPAGNALRPCWDTLGNSYRASLSGYSQASGGTSYAGAFAVGPWGHRLSTLPNQDRLVLIGEPPWFHSLGLDALDPPPIGWHGIPLADNVLYCDGSARLTSARGGRQGFARRPRSADTLALNDPNTCASTLGYSGPTWQLDCYPTPGAVIWGNWSFHISQPCWPWKNAYLNPSGGQLSVDTDCAGENP